MNNSNIKITALRDKYNKLTGKYQKGDFRKDSLFNKHNCILFDSIDEFNKAISIQNTNVNSSIKEDEVAKALGYKDWDEYYSIINKCI